MFIFTLVNLGSEKLLKEEINIKYPELKFAYSKPGFLTFKNTNSCFDNKFDFIFARRYGESIGKFNKLEMEEYVKKNNDKYKIEIYTNNFEIIQKDSPNVEDNILNIVKISDNEYWIGFSKLKEKYEWKFCGAFPKLLLPPLSP